MKIIVDQERVDWLITELLSRWHKSPKEFPFDREDAVIPQTIIPMGLRDDKRSLAYFYFYLCIYMRGGIESLQAFRALLNMRESHEYLFDPVSVQLMEESTVERLLRKYIGWDAKNAAKNWVINSRRLVSTWGADPRNLVGGVTTYEEALRRIRAKTTKRERNVAGEDGLGFRGFQYKMVSMLLYFFDWERMLQPRFLYPSPADFHNFRMALVSNSIRIEGDSTRLRSGEVLARPWRDAVMKYLSKTGADPVSVADVLWLYSLVMCGNSPVTHTFGEPRRRAQTSGHARQQPDGEQAFMHLLHETPSNRIDSDVPNRTARRKILGTCGVCFLNGECRTAVPARPYYRQGKIVRVPREPVPNINPPQRSGTKPATTQLELF